MSVLALSLYTFPFVVCVMNSEKNQLRLFVLGSVGTFVTFYSCISYIAGLI